MKKIGILNTALVSVMLIGTASFGYAQQDDQHRNRDWQQDRHAQGRQGDRQQQDTQGGQQQRQRHEEQQQPARNDGRDAANRARQRDQERQPARGDYSQGPRDQQRPQQGNWQQHRADHFDADHRSWEQRGGYHGYRIPQDRFRSSFGRGHGFHVYSLPYMEVGGRARFQYNGYWLSMMEPYPEYWGADWYQNDDMYVDYNGGGYYLYNRRFPGRPGVALSISF